MINWRKIIGGYLLLTGLFIACEYLALRWLLPVSFWFEYRQVAVVPPVIPGGPLRFSSSIDRYRTSDMQYNDALFCDTGKGKFETFSIQPVSDFNSAPARSADDSALWWYTADVPEMPARCYLRAVPAVKLRYGIIRAHQPIYTDPFDIGDRQ